MHQHQHQTQRSLTIRITSYVVKTIVVIFAFVGITFVGMYFAIRFHWTDEDGVIDGRSESYNALYAHQAPVIDTTNAAQPHTTNLTTLNLDELLLAKTSLETEITKREQAYCAIAEVAKESAPLASNLYTLYKATTSYPLIERIFFAFSTHGIPTPALEATPSPDCLANLEALPETDTPTNFPQLGWTQNEEWSTIRTAVQKDETVIKRAAEDVGIEPRLLTVPLIVEQLRLFHTQRGLFKQYFQPLSILASATKTSWGVMSIKEATAIAIEDHLTDSTSPFYLGTELEHALDFSTNDHTKERYDRLTNEDDHYYSYLYAALYIKQLITQWDAAGYTIADRPEIIATLYNIGFKGSEPKESPEVGGAGINISGTEYTFGSLGFEYYYSTLLMQEFHYTSY